MIWLVVYLVAGLALSVVLLRFEALAFSRKHPNLYPNGPTVDRGADSWVIIIFCTVLWPMMFPMWMLLYNSEYRKTFPTRKRSRRSIVSYLTGLPDGD